MMTYRRAELAALSIFSAALLGGCAATSNSESVNVTATYRERIAMQPDAVLEASILDISLADVISETLGSVRIEDPGNPPYEIEIPFDSGAIEEGRTYSVRAAIRANSRLLFTTDTVYPVLTRGAGRNVDVLLRMVARSDEAENPLTPMPATFTGVIPCADCPGIFYHLNLFADGSYVLQKSYLDRGEGGIFNEIGSWDATEDEKLLLWAEADEPSGFRILDSETVRLLDRNGNDIESTLNYDLSRTNEFIAMELQLEMNGMYQYMADAARFTECLSGRSFPVAFEAESIELEREYLELRRLPGDSLLASFGGRVAMRPRMEGDGQELHIVVENFGGVWPAETCGARKSMSELQGTNWVLTRLRDRPIVANPNARPPRLMLSSSERIASGFSGCNNFSGGYEIDGNLISFGQLAVTRMACAEGGDTEREFLDALGSTTSWRRIRHHLEFYNAAGEIVARLEARHFD